MVSQFIVQSRTERVIAAGRVLLAATALLNVWLDPPPVEGAAVAFVLLAAYLGYAIGLVPILRPAFAPAALAPERAPGNPKPGRGGPEHPGGGFRVLFRVRARD